MVERRWLPIPLVLLALVATGCGDEKTAKDVKEGTSTAATTTTGESAGGASTQATIDKLAAAVGTDVKKAPKLIATSGTPPTTLVKKDIVEGDGTAAKLGDNVEVRYTLAVWDGEKVESSWDQGDDPVSFPLAEGGLIEGWIKGVPGMKAGGRRLLVVPPDLGYGAQGQGAAVPPNATLIFVIDLAGIGKG